MKRTLSVLIFLPCLSLVALADTPELEPSHRAERFVISQVLAGEPADLAKFTDPSDRVLGFEFLNDLLTNSSTRSEVRRHGVHIVHATFSEDIELENVEVPFEVKLSDCHFLGDVELSQSHFKRNLELSGSEFESTLNLIGAVVDGNLAVRKTRFNNTEDEGSDNPADEADFSDLRVGGDFDLEGAVFAGKAVFIRDEIGKNINAKAARFTNLKNEVSFDSMTVNGYALFEDSVFSFSANFAYARISRNFGAERARFGNPYDPGDANAYVIFNSMKVGGNAYFNQTEFNGWVDFGNAEVGGNFEPTQARFNSPYSSANFTGMKVDVADFRLARFKNDYSLDAMTYRDLKADDLRAFVSRASYSEDAYASLESFLKRQGREGSANNIYVAQKRRERGGLNLPGKIGSVLLDWVVGYGRRPWLAFIWGGLFIAVGWLVFRHRKDMEPQKPEYENRPYSAFWYSLDLFLPFVDLQAAGFWAPRKDRRFARTYVGIHTLLGWILIPIGLAAVSGLIR